MSDAINLNEKCPECGIKFRLDEHDYACPVRIAELEREVERLRKDGERLDFIAKLDESEVNAALVLGWYWDGDVYHSGLRAAIDAAMEAER